MSLGFKRLKGLNQDVVTKVQQTSVRECSMA